MYAFRGRPPPLLFDARAGAETLPALREGAALYVDGKATKRNPTRFTITGAIQPLSGNDLLIVPEGDRFTEQYWVWQALSPGVTGIEVEDKLLREGKTFQVQMAKPWGDVTGGTGFIQARVMRVDVGPDATSWPDEPAEKQ